MVKVKNHKYPIYVISKGRWESRLTVKALESMRVPYHVVVEPQEYESYAAVIDEKKIYKLPFSNLGQGSIPARNWVWEHALESGAERHWIIDDNIRWFGRLHKRKKTRVSDGVCFRAIEDFADRYENVALAGMQYEMFTPVNEKRKPLILNTRIYSCILILNSLTHRWRGRYNEDTDLSLRVLKDGWCTVLFQSFICKKTATMRMKGGNTDELYRQDENFDGRYEMARSLFLQHPKHVRIKRRWGRWQHVVDYRPFKSNRLKLKPDVKVDKKVDNFGMVLRKKKKR